MVLKPILLTLNIDIEEVSDVKCMKEFYDRIIKIHNLDPSLLSLSNYKKFNSDSLITMSLICGMNSNDSMILKNNIELNKTFDIQDEREKRINFNIARFDYLSCRPNNDKRAKSGEFLIYL